MRKINLYHQICVTLSEVGYQKFMDYLLFRTDYNFLEIEEIINRVRKSNDVWHTELWRFMHIFGKDICSSLKDRAFIEGKIFVKDSQDDSWNTLQFNDVVNVKLTSQGREHLKSSLNLSEEMLEAFVAKNQQRLFLWELMNIYGSSILKVRPFQQQEIIFEKELPTVTHQEANVLIEEKTIKEFLMKIYQYLEDLKMGNSINSLYKSLLAKNNIKYLSRKGYAHSTLEVSSSRMVESPKNIFFEEELDALAYAYEKSELCEKDVPLAIRKRVIEMKKETPRR